MTRKPFFRSFDGCWYVQGRLEGKRKQIKLLDPSGEPIRGAEKQADAYQAFHKLMVQDPTKAPEPTSLRAADICDLFLEYSAKHNSCETFRWYQKYLQSFSNLFGSVPALDVKPYHVSRWLDRNANWHTSRRCAIIALKRAYNWCDEQELIPTNPLKRVRKPSAVRRERILAADERAAILGAIRDQEFREFIFALEQTGCRPGEIARVTAANVDLKAGVWVFDQHKTKKKTGKPRVVYLTPGMLELTGKLVAEFPDGPLFRGPARAGRKPYSANSIRCRFRRLRKKLPQLKGVIAYTFRHSYVTDALERGVPIASIAELAGHRDLRMIQEHYGHLSQKRLHLQEAARKAVGYGEDPAVAKKPA